MQIIDNNPNLVPQLLLIIAIGILAHNLTGIIYSQLRLNKLKHLKGLIIENHKKFQRKRNL